MRRGRLGQYGLVERMEDENLVKGSVYMNVEDRVKR